MDKTKNSSPSPYNSEEDHDLMHKINSLCMSVKRLAEDIQEETERYLMNHLEEK